MTQNAERRGENPANQQPRPNGKNNVTRPRTLRKVELIPVSVSQLTSEAVLGIPERRFREWVRARHLAHSTLGKLVIVELTVALAALRAEAGEGEQQTPLTEVERIRAAAGIRVGGSR